jgi:hypothetical protein
VGNLSQKTPSSPHSSRRLTSSPSVITDRDDAGSGSDPDNPKPLPQNRSHPTDAIFTPEAIAEGDLTCGFHRSISTVI